MSRLISSRLVLLAFMAPSLVLGYVGTQSFRLEDDQEYAQMQNLTQQSKINFVRAEEIQKTKEQRAIELRRDYQELRARLDALPSELTKLQDQQARSKAIISSLNTSLPVLDEVVKKLKIESDKAQEEFKALFSTLEVAQKDLGESDKACKAAPTPECEALVNEKKVKVADLQKAFIEKRESSKNLKSEYDAKSKELEIQKKTLAQTQLELRGVEDRLVEALKLQQDGKLKLVQLERDLDISNRELSIASRELEEARNRYNLVSVRFDRFRTDLLNAIDQLNFQGANIGSKDGGSDGIDLAISLGRGEGSADGRSDGLTSGKTEGEKRDYQLGWNQGAQEGNDRAQKEGTKKGTEEGTKRGNIVAGQREGSQEGIRLAERSDAASVGQKQGQTSGLERAKADGQKIGSAQGESQAIQQFENQTLESVVIEGPYVGTFERRVPGMPQNYRGPKFNFYTSNPREVLRRAFADGYVFKYDEFARAEFLRNIDREYARAYDDNYQLSYNSSFQIFYKDQFEGARARSESDTFIRQYPVVKDQVFREVSERVSQNPDRSGDIYRSEYGSSKTSAYNRRYEVIRSENFAEAEARTYDQNVASETEINRVSRQKQVEKIYLENAVVEYVQSFIADGGIDGVGRTDEIYMPNEKIVHTIVVKNYGHKELNGAKVVFASGESAILPAIPARSIVTLKGIALSKVDSAYQVGQTAKDQMRVIAPLTTDDSVQSRHYDDVGRKLLKENDTKSFMVNYPLQVRKLALSQGQLMLNQKQNLILDYANISKKDLLGKVDFLVSSNAVGNWLNQGFSSLDGLKGSGSVRDAEIELKDAQDSYRQLSIDVDVRVNGVTVGKLNNALSLMAKAPYVEKLDKPVLVAKSDLALEEFLNVISDFGGQENLSILDYSLPKENDQTIKKGINDKINLVVSGRLGQFISSLEGYVSNSKNSLFIYSDVDNTATAEFKKLPSLASNRSFPFQLVGMDAPIRVYFTSAYRSSSKGMSMHVAVQPRDIQAASDLLKDFGLNNEQLFELINKEVDRDSYFTPQASIQVLAVKALAQLMDINKSYDDSGHVFTRDKKWIKMIESDQNLLINLVRAKVQAANATEQLGTILAAVGFYDILLRGINDYNPIEDEMMSKVNSAIKDQLTKLDALTRTKLSKIDRELFNRVYAKVSHHRPF